ncbi:PQQ-binding-like beta-propeller repeat protein [Streptomyces sp. CC228A]|uniref:protein kinase domain-containing protein n=1 Tax=Streptomyces sp. CC228A TaxID=2898186 RepID=UPI001F31D177|nr:PQQ-binding-like beta-propeller repeat protein [Streptomyces sp. CC228A]
MKRLGAGDPREIGPYRLLARLGAGGMGTVYLGRSSGGRTVAVKAVRPDLALDGPFRDRFRREVAAARLVSGAFTAPVVDADPDAEVPWMATAFVVGVSLHQAVAAHGPLPEAALRMLTAGLAEALVGIHAAKVIHRDLKPANVLLALDGPHVIDFGIARAVDSTALTSTGSVIGSAPYMSPEQALGRHLTPASDVFSLATTVAFAASGHSPFGDGAVAAVLFRVVHTEPDVSAVPGSLRPLIDRCLAKDPGQRPTPRAVIAAIERPDPRLAFAGGSRPRPSAGWLPDPVAADVLALRAALAAPPDPEPTALLTGLAEAVEAQRPGSAPGRRKLLLGLAGGALAVAAGAGAVAALSRDGGAGTGGGKDTPTTAPRPPAESVPDARLAWQTRLPASVAQVLPGNGTVACVTLEAVVGLDRKGDTAWTVKGADHEIVFSVTGPTARTIAATAGDRLYVSGATTDARHAAVLAIRMADGKEPWTATLTDRRATGVLGVPGVRDGRAYLLPLTGDGSSTSGVAVWALELATRRTAWVHPAEAIPAFWGLPRSGGGLLYADADRIVAVDGKGRTTWSKKLKPVLVGAAGRHFLVADATGTLSALDPATGRQAWRAPGVVGASVRGDGVATDPRGSVVFVLLEEDGGFALAALDAAGGKPRWRRSIPADAGGSGSFGARLLYGDGHVYRMGADGMIWAFDASTGDPRWKYGGFRGSSPMSLAWAAGDRRLCICDTGATTVASLDANGA